jgi:hypothetical protein
MRRFASVFASAALLVCLAAAPAWTKEFKKTVRFERGSTSATLSGSVVRGDRDVYELGASAGQVMEVGVTALEDNAAFVIKAPGGRSLPGAAETDGAAIWRGELPASGTYRIEVGGTRGNAEYTLRVVIE